MTRRRLARVFRLGAAAILVAAALISLVAVTSVLFAAAIWAAWIYEGSPRLRPGERLVLRRR